MNQRDVLSVIGCGGSLAIALALTGPASASPIAPAEAEPTWAETAALVPTPASGNILRDALGCGCVTCQASQRQTMF